jgi:transcriptional regulator GlxA family with amidase domain
MAASTLSVGALLYPGFEMLDMFGPLEMFSVLGPEQVQIHMLAEQAAEVPTAFGFGGDLGPRVCADYSFATAPAIDVLLIPGGTGTLQAVENTPLLEFVRQCSATAQYVASVCTGSAILAKAGVLDGRRATSNKQVFALATMQSDAVQWQAEARWVEDGKFFTSSGVSAGMDMSLALIEQHFGAQVAQTVANGTEYTRHLDADSDPFAGELNKLAAEMGLV